MWKRCGYIASDSFVKGLCLKVLDTKGSDYYTLSEAYPAKEVGKVWYEVKTPEIELWLLVDQKRKAIVTCFPINETPFGVQVQRDFKEEIKGVLE
jgi:hypothetical protein